MAGRLILLDTGVLIKVERGQLDMRQVIGGDDPANAGVSRTTRSSRGCTPYYSLDKTKRPAPRPIRSDHRRDCGCDRALVTTDKSARFDELPGVTAEVVTLK